MTVPVTYSRRLLVSLTAAAALLFAACGGNSVDTELTISDDGVRASALTDPDPVEVDAGGPAELSTARAAAVPEAVPPRDPLPATSPAGRQRLQELGLLNEPIVSPEPQSSSPQDGSDAGSPDTGEAASERYEPAGRPDLGEFPAEIPAVVERASSGQNANEGERPTQSVVDQPADSGWDFGDDEFFDPIDDELAILDEGVDDTATTVLPNDAGDADHESENFDEGEDDCPTPQACGDIARVSGDGVGDAGTLPPALGAAGTESQPLEDGAQGAANCEARPYSRGCPLPRPHAPGGLDAVDTEGDDPGDGDRQSDGAADDDGDDARQSEGVGVDVPQEVIDALLAPIDDDSPIDDETPDVDAGASGTDQAGATAAS